MYTIRDKVFHVPIFTVNNTYDNTKSTIIDTIRWMTSFND